LSVIVPLSTEPEHLRKPSTLVLGETYAMPAMNRTTNPRHERWHRRLRRQAHYCCPVVIMTTLLVTFFSPKPVLPQRGLDDLDYFVADPRGLLHTVERVHLHAGVWKNFSTGQYEFALADVKYTLDRFANHPKALALLGAIAKMTKTPSLPIPYFEKALRLYPQYALTHAQFGAYLVDIGKIDEGIARLKRAVHIDPNLALAHAWLGNAYYKSGKPELALQAAQRAKELGHKGRILEEMPKDGPER
jgi:hypothetical protein